MDAGIFYEKPLVSIVMPAYNSSKYIGNAIESVLNQTIENWELLVIDDCSSDDTCRIVKSFTEQDRRIRLILNEANIGTAKTRNRGLDMCRGDYAAFLDSDDIWHPDKLEKQLALAKTNAIDLVYASYTIVDEHSNKCCNDYIVPQHTDISDMLKNNVIGCSTVLLSKPVYSKFRFSSEYYHEDYVMWLEILRSGNRAAGISDVLADYRYRTDSRAANKFIGAKRRWQIYRSFMQLSLSKSIYYMVHYAFAGAAKYCKR